MGAAAKDSPDPAEAAGRYTGDTSMDASQWNQRRRRLLRHCGYPLHYPGDFVFRGRAYPHTLDAGLAAALQTLQTAKASDASDAALPGVPPHLDWTPALLKELMTELLHDIALLAAPVQFRPSEYYNVVV